MTNEQNEQENKQKRRARLIWSEDEDSREEKIGLWFALGAAAAVVLGVLGFSVFGSDAGKAAMGLKTGDSALVGQTLNASGELNGEFGLNGDDANQAGLVLGESALQGGATLPGGSALPNGQALQDGNASSHGDSLHNGDVESAEHNHTTDAHNQQVEVILDARADNHSGVVNADDVKVVVGNGVVKFYFASGKAELAANAMDSLRIIVDGVKAGKKAVVSGYADSTGNAALNAELSKKRAFQVRNALLNAGVPESSIEMLKPQNITGSGAQNEARRVEVVLK